MLSYSKWLSGTIQWQSFDGTNWVNETGPGLTPASIPYRLQQILYTEQLTSGGCDPDTSVSLNLDVISISDPTVQNDTLCGNGTANLSASGPGQLDLYTAPYRWSFSKYRKYL